LDRRAVEIDDSGQALTGQTIFPQTPRLRSGAGEETTEMNAFISYSIHPNEQYLLTLLAQKLSERGLSFVTSYTQGTLSTDRRSMKFKMRLFLSAQ
jgi:hypothetical protein